MPEAPGAGWRVLVVDDEEPLARIIASYLQRQGFTCDVALDGNSALSAAATAAPDFVVLDAMLPGLHGFEVCRRLRATSDAYIVMVTALGDVDDVVEGLAAGADDYVTKPFSPRELAARLLALLRRPRRLTDAVTPDPVVVVGELTLDPSTRQVHLADAEIRLTPTEFGVLQALARAEGRAVSRREILADMWGSSWFGDDHVVDVHVANLRRKLGESATTAGYVETVRGLGYRVADPRATV